MHEIYLDYKLFITYVKATFFGHSLFSFAKSGTQCERVGIKVMEGIVDQEKSTQCLPEMGEGGRTGW